MAIADRRCPACAEPVVAEHAFCGRCGARVEPERGRSDRRTVTVLFADLAGFTRLGGQLDPEVLTEVIHEGFGQLMEEIRELDGWIEKHIGDAILAVFGAPVAHEDDPVRAVRAALAMQERMRSINRGLDGRLAAPLQLRIGVNTGLVVMKPGIDDPDRGDPVVVGDTVNTGARLEQTAEPGRIVVSESTYAATRHAFDYRRLPSLEVKGKAEKLTVYECLGPIRATAKRGIAAPLVGRDGELGALVARIETLARGLGGALAVVGDAGIGKSRLVTEARRAAGGADVRCLEARALSFSRTLSYAAFLELLRRDAEIVEDDPAALQKLERRVREVAPDDVADLVPYLATLLGIEVTGELAARVRYLDAEALRRQIFSSSRRWFERLARRRPLLVVLEDWHWADEASHDLLEHLLPLTAAVPLVFCCVCRPEREGPAARFRRTAAYVCGDGYRELVLEPLSSAQTGELVRSLLEVQDLSPRVRDRIFAKAEGNPFFIEEIVRSLVDVHAIERDERTGAWRATPELEHVTIPDTLRGVITARVDRLDASATEVLHVAAVIGRSFTDRLLRSAADPALDLGAQLELLGRLELIREKTRVPELEYIFKHAVTQEAIYESILLSRRRELHAQVAALIEELYADRREEVYGLLALHYARAERWDKAQEYLLEAGDQAGRLAADTEALAHYRDALAAHARAFGEQWNPLQRAVLERKMGEALFRRGDHSEAAEYLQRALAYLGTKVPSSRLRVRLALPKHLLRQGLHRLVPRLFVRPVGGAVDSVAQERAYIYEVLNWIDFFLDQERFVLDSVMELNLSERSGYGKGVVRASFAMGVLCDTVPIVWLADRYLVRALALATDLGNPALLAEAFLRRGMHEHYPLGHWESALELYTRSAGGFREAGDLRGWGAATALSGSIVRSRGDVHASFELGREVARVGQDGGDRQVWGWGLGEEARNLRLLGRLDEAVARDEQAIELLDSIPDHLSVVSALGDLARCHLRQGRLEEAMQVIERADRLVSERRLRAFLCTPAAIGRAEVWLAAAEAEPASRAAHLKRARRACRTAVRQGGLDREALPAAYRCRGTYEWLRGRRRRAEAWWRRSAASAESLGSRIELAATLLEEGSRTEERGPLERAERIFAEAGAAFELAAAQEQLGRARGSVAAEAAPVR